MTPEKHTTLSVLLADVKRTLAERFPLGVWICAEIGELKVNSYSGHCYLELIEKGERDGAPKAKAAAAIWRNKWSAIESYFRAATGERLAVGMSVLLKVSVSFHEVYGLSLVVSDIDPSYTLGEGERRRRATIEALETDGILELNRTLPFPTVIQRLAVISSATAAGLQDFHNHLHESPWRIHCELFEATVQGAAAEESIIQALGEVAAREEEFDAVAIIRGGGSRSDLECFDSYPLCAHIAQFPLPVITGIGHDKDISVADLVAARPLKTPTAVADLLVALAEGLHTELSSLYERIANISLRTLATHSSTLALHGAKLSSGSHRLLGSHLLTTEKTSMRLRHATERTLSNARNRLAAAEAVATAASPQRILSLGFALVRRNGKVVSDSRQLALGDNIELTLANGTRRATITDTENNE